MEDALRLIELIERLALHGQKVRASKAVKICEYGERTIALLRAEL
jgi:predicted DNA-binding transcriptional regulator YafY